MRQCILRLFLFFVLPLFPLSSSSQVSPVPMLEIERIAILAINSAITPATYDYIKYNFSQISKKTLVILKVNTPGGLVTTTKDIITLIGKEDRPVVVWITPEGASASSAGAIIASSAHFIFMAPGTNLGAATPVGLGGDIGESDGRNKALNDLTALVRSLSQQRNRPHEPFEEMISKATSFTDREALKLKIINGISSDLDDLLSKINNQTFVLQGKTLILSVKSSTPFENKEPSLGQKILEVLANPSTAYFLFLIGVALIYFEFQAPGGYIAGSVGLCFLLLAAIAFQVLPLNWGAFGLLILGVIFFILEVFITSYGLLSLAGLASFVMGSLFLFNGDTGFISIEYPVMLSTLVGVFTGVGFLVWYLIQDQKKQKAVKDFFLPIGAVGTIMTVGQKGDHYQIKVRGEIWKATSKEELNIGDSAEVIAINQEHLIAEIKKVHQ